MPHLEYNGKKIYYQINEKEENKAIIFIHGSGENSIVWKGQLNDLNLNYTLIAIDLPSHAESDDFPELSLDLYLDVIKKLVDFLKLKKIVLCGHSLGGAIVQEYFFKNRKEVSALILCGTGARLRVSPMILNSLKNNYQEFLNGLPIGAFYRKTPKEIKEALVIETAKTKPEVTYADFKICDNFDVMDKVASINVPCLIVCGNEDKLTPVKYSQYFKDKIKDSKLVVIKDAGHMVMLEKPNELNKAIEEFIENNL
ncbi:MAG: alpha/beta hydrolase [Promethearchaeota archaeon]|nr:MAG: alpha/beta hydrolase [Candidatus Lokiarchaeota archaeon]